MGAEEGLRMLENHLWTAEAGDESDGEVGTSVVSDVFRLCMADFDRISPLKVSTALYLLSGQTNHYLRVGCYIYSVLFLFWFWRGEFKWFFMYIISYVINFSIAKKNKLKYKQIEHNICGSILLASFLLSFSFFARSILLAFGS